MIHENCLYNPDSQILQLLSISSIIKDFGSSFEIKLYQRTLKTTIEEVMLDTLIF